MINVAVAASYYPKHFFSNALSNYMTFPLLTGGFFTFDKPGIYPQVYHRTQFAGGLLCKGV